jgi:hypothetical protein
VIVPLGQQPRLRSASKVAQLYPLNQFPVNFSKSIAKAIFAVKATSLFEGDDVDVSGKLWEEIFAKGIGAKRESGLAEGLDDVRDVGTSTAWSAKTVKHNVKAPIVQAIEERRAKVQLISGRNDPFYSFSHSVNPKVDDPKVVAEMILEIWNERVRLVKKEFTNLRTVVLVKQPKLNTVAVFEKTTDLYHPSDYKWEWNKNSNLVGSRDGTKCFTWQPHGKQFTINDVPIPSDSLILDIKEPKKLGIDDILKLTGWDDQNFTIV